MTIATFKMIILYLIENNKFLNNQIHDYNRYIPLLIINQYSPVFSHGSHYVFSLLHGLLGVQGSGSGLALNIWKKLWKDPAAVDHFPTKIHVFFTSGG